MNIEPPFSIDQFVDAAYELELPENHTGVRAVPRASGLGSCARKQAYYMAGVEPSNPQREDAYRKNGVLTTEQGRYIEDLTCDIIEWIVQSEGFSFKVTNRQIELPEDALVSGHPDGELVLRSWVDDSLHPMPDGLKWGFEHKHLGRYSYVDLFKNGYMSDQGYWAQLLLYGYYLEWDAVLVAILAQDASSIRTEINQALSRLKGGKSKNPGYYRWAESPALDAKIQFHAFYLRPHYEATVPTLLRRAEFLAGVSNPKDVAREADANPVNPRNGRPAFPCGYCDYVDQCIADGPGKVAAPAC